MSLDLSYRPLETGDLDALTVIVSDWEVVRQLGSWPWPPEPDFNRSRCIPYSGDGFVWGIIADNTLVGTVSVTGGELGYSLRRASWGQGIISRAAGAAVDNAFVTLEHWEIEASIWADNVASRRVLARLGFQLVLTEMVHSKARNIATPSETLNLTRARWQDLSNRSQSVRAGA